MFDTADLMKAITTIQTVTPPFIPADAEVMTSIIEWPPGSSGAPPIVIPAGPRSATCWRSTCFSPLKERRGDQGR